MCEWGGISDWNQVEQKQIQQKVQNEAKEAAKKRRAEAPPDAVKSHVCSHYQQMEHIHTHTPHTPTCEPHSRVVVKEVCAFPAEEI